MIPRGAAQTLPQNTHGCWLCLHMIHVTGTEMMWHPSMELCSGTAETGVCLLVARKRNGPKYLQHTEAL